MFNSDLVTAQRSRQRAPFGFGGSPSHMPPFVPPMQGDGSGMGTLQLPGMVGGFGGGTFDMDGTPVTPVDRGGSPEPTAPAPNVGGIFGKSGSAGRKPWQDVVQSIGAALAAFGGNMVPSQMMMQDRMFRQRSEAEAAARKAQWDREDAQRREGRAWAVEDRDAQLNAPQYFNTGRDRVMFDPRTGESRIVYDGPEDFQTYAEAMGFEPETEAYRSAMTDYVLRGNGPTALQNDLALEGAKHRNRLTLRATPTYGQANPRPSVDRRNRSEPGAPRSMSAVMTPILAKVARGEQLTPAEQRAWAMYRPGRGSGQGSSQPPSTGPTATDPKTGRKVRWNGKAWVPAA